MSVSVFVTRNEPFEIWTLRLTNIGEIERRASCFSYIPIKIDGFTSLYEFGSWHKTVRYVPKINGLFAKNKFPNPAPEMYTAMLIVSLPITG